MPIRGSSNEAAHSCPRSPQPQGLVDAIARNAVDVINRYGWTSSIGIAGRHHSVRPSKVQATSSGSTFRPSAMVPISIWQHSDRSLDQSSLAIFKDA